MTNISEKIVENIPDIIQKTTENNIPPQINLKLWLIISAFLFTPIILVFIFKNRKIIKEFFYKNFRKDFFMIAYFIMPNKQIRREPVLLDGKQFNFKNDKYVVDVKYLLFNKQIPEGFWFWKNPAQIKFDISEFKIEYGLDSGAFNEIIKNKFLKELVSKKEEIKFAIITLIIVSINLILTIVLNAIKFKK